MRPVEWLMNKQAKDAPPDSDSQDAPVYQDAPDRPEEAPEGFNPLRYVNNLLSKVRQYELDHDVIKERTEPCPVCGGWHAGDGSHWI